MGDFFRFDLKFDGPEPALDDVSVMKELGEIARETIMDSPALDRLILRIRAELFIFELDASRPFLIVDGMYEGTGKILCRLRARTPEYNALMAQLDQASASFLIGDNVMAGKFQDRSARLKDGNFSKDVKFRTPSRHDPFVISLHEDGAPCPISGAPFTLQRLLDTQRLEARFGTTDHQKRKWTSDEIELLPKKRVRINH